MTEKNTELVTSVIAQAAGAVLELHPEMGGGHAYDLVEAELKRNDILGELEYRLAGGAIGKTLEHIRRVQTLIGEVAHRLIMRAIVHDASKLEEPEKSAFDKSTRALAGLTYGTPEYMAQLKALGPALQHHYENNSHHPEYFNFGIDGMSLLDVVEMLCDWKAASERHNNGSISKSIEINRDRFKLSPQLEAILRNTVVELGWIEIPEVPR